MKSFLFCLILSLSYIHLYANNSYLPDTTNTSNQNIAENEQVDEIKNIKGDIDRIWQTIEENKNADKSPVGMLRIKNWDAIPIKVSGEFPSQQQIIDDIQTVDIQKITFIVKDGYMNDVQIWAKSGDHSMKFTNMDAPIGITTSRLDRGDNLTHVISRNMNYVLFTNSFWDYESRGSYAPTDSVYTVTRDEYWNNEAYNDGIVLYRNSGIDSIFDIRFYSDALATFGKESNGLIQTDVAFKHLMHRKNVKDHGWMYPLHYLKFNLSLKKFDSRFSSTDSSNFSRSRFIQRSWLKSDFSLNIYSIWLEKKSLSSFYVDMGATLLVSDLKKDTTTTTTLSHGFFTEFGVDLQVAENVGSELSTRPMLHFSPATDFNNQNKNRVFLTSQMDIFWNPVSKKSNRLFARLSHTIDMSRKNNSFFEFQFGYSVRLSDLK